MANKYPLTNSATQWARQVVSGRVNCCRYVQLTAQRHIDGLKGQGQFYFDKAASERACGFAGELKHVKGKWRGSKISLQPWQLFIISNVFGWKVKSTGKRKYREAYIEVPRKNGKSVLAAVIGLYMLTIDGEPGAEVYSGATSERQAMEVFRPAWHMVHTDQELKKELGLDMSGTAQNPTSKIGRAHV